MKFLYFTDPHCKGVNPSARLGDFQEDMLCKFHEIGNLIKEYKVDAVICGGDLFDSPAVSLSVCDAFVDVMEGWGVRILVCRGNHDEIGHNPNASGQSVLDHIFRRSIKIEHLGGTAFKDDTAYVEGFDYYHNIENDINEKGLMSSLPGVTKKSIAVVHAFIVDKAFLPQIPHCVIQNIKTDFDLVLLSHVHWQMGVIKAGKTVFVSPGALCRTSISDVNRMPAVVFIDTGEPVLKMIPLTCAKPGDVLFDTSKIADTKEFNGRIDDFINSLQSAKFQGLNLKATIEAVGKEKGVGRDVINETIRRVEGYEHQ